ncbi:MAG: ADOP family duplicated permease [Bryobacteraceae bacterium]
MTARFVRKILALVQRRRLDRELAEEIETHRILLEQSAGQSAAAKDAARKQMGNLTLAREESRDMWTFRQLEWIIQDSRIALRGLRRSPVFTAVAIASLALGIGANTAIFSFVNAILLKRLPVAEPERLVTFTLSEHGKRGGGSLVWTLGTLEQVAKQATTVDGIFGWFTRPVSFTAGNSVRWINGEMVTGQYFRTLQVQPAIGRLFDDDDVRNAPGNPVCVLSYAFWQREFAGDSGIIGRSVLLNGHAYRVLGVTTYGFIGAALQQRFDVVVPATRIVDFMPAFGTMDWLNRLSWMAPMARLKPGVSVVQAQKQIERLFPDWRKRELVLQDGSQGFNRMRSQFGQPILALMAVVALVLLVACANLANLMLARSQVRAKEFAVRLSIGASRGRLIRQLLVESLLLALGGGAAGVALAFWIGHSLIAFLNANRSSIYALHLEPDARVLAFSILLSFATAILFGWAPAWQATRPDLLPGLRQESATRGPLGRVLLRRSLVVFQIAMSVVIVFAAGLLTRTLRSLTTVDLGFQPDRVIALNVDPAASGHSAAEASAIFDEILKRARDLPGVKAASMAANPPFGSTALSMSIQVPGLASEPVVFFDFISPQYFATLGQPLLRGRDLDERDNKNAPRVAIVNENLARLYFNGRDPVGRKFRQGQGGGDIEIVGVVRDAREGSVRGGPVATVYLPSKQGTTSGLTLLTRTADDSRRVVPALLGVVQRIDRRLPVYSVHTMDIDVQAGFSSERILGLLSTLFAALATLLASIGLYGVLAYAVLRRTREIGVRFAVGAQRRDVARLFARESVLLVLAGLAIGVPMALISARAFGSLLFGVAPSDPVTLVASAMLLALAALLATSIPLWRASRVNPVVALRCE